MRAQIQRLLELQTVDLHLEDLRKFMAAIPTRNAEIESRLGVAKSKLAAARDAHTTALKDRKKYELDVEQWREKGKKYRDQSYEVKTNDAFRALQHEITNADAEMARAEDRLLERMVAGEDFDRQIKAGEAGLKEAEAVAAGEQKVLEQERAEKQTELSAAEAQRATIVAEIPEDLLKEYNRIATHRHGALAQALNEMCMKCGVRMRPHIYQLLRMPENQEVQFCESCGRILYYEVSAPQMSSTPAEAGAAAGAHGAAPSHK